jgi:hypothetical protein
MGNRVKSPAVKIDFILMCSSVANCLGMFKVKNINFICPGYRANAVPQRPKIKKSIKSGGCPAKNCAEKNILYSKM